MLTDYGVMERTDKRPLKSPAICNQSNDGCGMDADRT
jgi:hypothetical protein